MVHRNVPRSLLACPRNGFAAISISCLTWTLGQTVVSSVSVGHGPDRQADLPGDLDVCSLQQESQRCLCSGCVQASSAAPRLQQSVVRLLHELNVREISMSKRTGISLASPTPLVRLSFKCQPTASYVLLDLLMHSTRCWISSIQIHQSVVNLGFIRRECGVFVHVWLKTLLGLG